jgi:hypothetical protein
MNLFYISTKIYNETVWRFIHLSTDNNHRLISGSFDKSFIHLSTDNNHRLINGSFDKSLRFHTDLLIVEYIQYLYRTSLSQVQ